MRWLSFFVLILIIAAPARADDHIFKPEGCEFSITFPGEPYETMRCDPDNPQKCIKKTSFTKVFGLDASVNFYVTCNPAEKDMYEHYSGDVMKATLAAMARGNGVEDFEAGFQQTDVAKEAVVLGTGKTGKSEKLYVSQLWIGHKSAFTVEAELIGEALQESDTQFANILRSVTHESWKDGADGKKDETPKEEKKAKKEDKKAKKPAETESEKTPPAAEPVPATAASQGEVQDKPAEKPAP